MRPAAPVELPELPDGVGDGEEPPGAGAAFRRPPSISSAHLVLYVSRWSSKGQACASATSFPVGLDRDAFGQARQPAAQDDAATLRDRLRAQAVKLAPGTVEAATTHVQLLVERLASGCLREGAKSYVKPKPTPRARGQEARTFWPCSRNWPCGPTYR